MLQILLIWWLRHTIATVLTRHTQERRKVYTRPFCGMARGWGAARSCPRARFQVVFFFSFSLSTFLKRRFTASICSLLLLSPFVSSLEMIQDSLQTDSSHSKLVPSNPITWRSRVHSSPQRSSSKKEERDREIILCVLGLCRTFWSLLFSSKLNVL